MYASTSVSLVSGNPHVCTRSSLDTEPYPQSQAFYLYLSRVGAPVTHSSVSHANESIENGSDISSRPEQDTARMPSLYSTQKYYISHK